MRVVIVQIVVVVLSTFILERSISLTLIGASAVTPDDEFGGQAMQFTLEHELVKGKFTKRALLSLMSYTSEQVLYRDEGLMTEEDLHSIVKLAEAGDIYRARVLFTVGNKAEYVYGFLYACDLVNSGLRDNITLSFNTHGSLVGLHLSVRDSGRAAFAACTLPAASGTSSSSSSSSSSWSSASALPSSFASYAVAARPVQGPAPETQIYINRMEEEKKRKHEAEHGDNRSFVSKYWMYIVPAAIVVMMMSSAQDPNAGGGGGN